jgi:3-oxoacyl-[acyl-carrier-protein] synthase-3
MKKVRILSTGSYLPGDPLGNDVIEKLGGALPPDVLEGIQVETRHWMIDPATGEHHENNSDLAYKATKEALELAGLEAEDIDLLVLSTGSPDYLLPPIVTMLQDSLGLQRCAVTEIRSGCAGFQEAMDVARLYLENGSYQRAVVVGSETISPLLVPIFLGKDPESIRMRDRLTLYNFGDGAGAMVLEATNEGEGVLGSAMCCIGGGKKPGMQIVGAGTHAPIHQQLKAKRLVDLKVDVVQSGEYTPYVLTEALAAILEKSGVSAESIDICVIPEGNAGYMTDELRAAGLLTPEWTTLEPKIFENLAMVGATGSAAVPLAVDYAWKTGRVKTGDRMMLLAIETSKWIYAGMVVPWTAATCPAERRVAVAARS